MINCVIVRMYPQMTSLFWQLEIFEIMFTEQYLEVNIRLIFNIRSSVAICKIILLFTAFCCSPSQTFPENSLLPSRKIRWMYSNDLLTFSHI